MSYVRCLRWKWYILICTRRNSSRFLPRLADLSRKECDKRILGWWFVCLFVCYYKTRKSSLRLPPWEGSKPPGSISTWTAWLPLTVVSNVQHCPETLYVPTVQGRRVGSHLWTYASPIQVASSATDSEERPRCHVWPPWYKHSRQSGWWFLFCLYVLPPHS